MIGGYDPVTNVYTAAVHYLLTNPDKLEKLQKEVRAIADASQLTNDRLQHLKYLDAVWNESLRIHTNAAFGLPRISPGDTVDGHYVPKGVGTSGRFTRTMLIVLCRLWFRLQISPTLTPSVISRMHAHLHRRGSYPTITPIMIRSLTMTPETHSSHSRLEVEHALD